MRHFFGVFFADRPPAKRACSMRGAFTMPTVHRLFLPAGYAAVFQSVVVLQF
jgi:hypothetical protein